MSPNHTSLAQHTAGYVRQHKLSLAVFLAAYGVFYLSAVIMGGWAPQEWGKDVFSCPPSAVHSLLPRSYISPIFFLTSLSALLIGTAMLCTIGIQELRQGTALDEHVAVALVAFGFAYQVVGAWPLQSAVDMPWIWQKQIMSYGSVFGWMLYAVSWFVLAVGAVSLYMHSRTYHQKHAKLSFTD